MGWSILGGEDTQFRSGEVAVRTFISRPALLGRHPAVILLPGILGPSAGTRRASERLAERGYVGQLLDWQSREQNPPDAEIMRYIGDAVEHLGGLDYVDGERIAVAGYCRGGGLALLAVEHHRRLRAAVAMHGFPFYSQLDEKKTDHPYDLAERIQVPLMILHGALDQPSPVANIYRMAQRLDELGKNYYLRVYGGTGHAFTLPDGSQYNPVAAEDAFEGVVWFLDRHLR